MRIKQAKAIIKYEAATKGVVTSEALRVYCEHRISKVVFDKLIQEGKSIFNKKNDK